jgi:hypothetical protein
MASLNLLQLNKGVFENYKIILKDDKKIVEKINVIQGKNTFVFTNIYRKISKILLFVFIYSKCSPKFQETYSKIFTIDIKLKTI